MQFVKAAHPNAFALIMTCVRVNGAAVCKLVNVFASHWKEQNKTCSVRCECWPTTTVEKPHNLLWRIEVSLVSHQSGAVLGNDMLTLNGTGLNLVSESQDGPG